MKIKKDELTRNEKAQRTVPHKGMFISDAQRTVPHKGVFIRNRVVNRCARNFAQGVIGILSHLDE